ncbi:MAG: dTMP kinase [Fibrobacter sp.]|nr:dTMP kinase [Fibrobacter sp.]
MSSSPEHRFFCIEGLDGCGKSTQINLLCEELGRRGFPTVRIREPGGTEISEKIRNIILSPAHGAMNFTTELLLYNAARAQLLNEVVRPALKQGKVVLADRFAWSSMAYQGYGRQLSLDTLRTVIDIAVEDLWPSHTFILDIPVEVFRDRAAKENRVADRLEQEKHDFFNRVRQGYQQIAKDFPEKCSLLDGTQCKIDIHKNILDSILAHITK